jgi:soluble lytic murein transglycosylase-like protein
MIATAAVSAAPSVNSVPTVTLVVRADARTGRLVRSVAKTPRAVPKKASPQIELPPAVGSVPPVLQNLVDRIAERHDVDRDLVHSVIRVESNYNPLAVSSKGALGLMQLIPSTARRFGVSNSFDPGANVDGGVRFLKYLLGRYNGDRRLVLAAYNAGETAVQHYGGVPPFAETRAYVNRVGKSLDLAKKEMTKTQSNVDNPPLMSSDGYNPVRTFTDAMGRTYYKTP